MRGYVPYVRGAGFAPIITPSVAIIAMGCRMNASIPARCGPGVTWLIRRSSAISRSQMASTGSWPVAAR